MHAYRRMPKIPVQALALIVFAAYAVFEIHTGGWFDFLLGAVITTIVIWAWAMGDTE